MLSYEPVCTSVGGFSQGQAPWAASVGQLGNIGFFQGCNGPTHAGTTPGQAKRDSDDLQHAAKRPVKTNTVSSLRSEATTVYVSLRSLLAWRRVFARVVENENIQSWKMI